MSTQRLYELDKLSTDFPKRLDELLHDKQWVGDLKLLPKDELQKLIDYLNNVKAISLQADHNSSPLDSRRPGSNRLAI